MRLGAPLNGKAPDADGYGLLLAVAALATVLAPLNSTMIAVALPDIAAEFRVGVAESSWLVVGYLICMAVVQPIGGALGDTYGRRRVVLGALVAFLVASLAALAAPTFAALVALRLTQALAGALAIPNAAALVREHVPEARRGAAYGLVGGVVGLAAGLGPPLGGVIVGLGGWRAIFAANAPVVAAGLALGWAALPRGARRPAPGRFDLAGALLLAGWLGGLALAASSLRSGPVPASPPLLGLAAAGLFGAFVARETGAARPVVHLGLFRLPGFAAAAGAVSLGNLAMYTTLLAVPQYLTLVEGRPAAEVGAVLAALSVPMALLGPFAGRLADLWGRRRVAVAGAAVTAAAFAPLLWLGSGWPPWLLAVPLAGGGVGLALQAPAVQAAAIEAAPAQQAGMASGVFSTSRYLGSIVGSAALGALLGSGASPSAAGLAGVFAMVEAAALGALAAAAMLQASQALSLPPRGRGSGG